MGTKLEPFTIYWERKKQPNVINIDKAPKVVISIRAE